MNYDRNLNGDLKDSDGQDVDLFTSSVTNTGLFEFTTPYKIPGTYTLTFEPSANKYAFTLL